MAIIATVGEGRDFAPAPEGLHQAICVDVVDIGILKVVWAGKTKEQHKVRLVWQIDEPMADGRPFLVMKRYTLSLHEKANLRKELESWRGRRFTDEELQGFDLEKLIGANAQLNVQHTTKEDKTYANVVSIVPLGKGMVKIAAKDYIRMKDRKPEDAPERTSNDGPLTLDDIPFMWTMPFIMPVVGLIGAGLVLA